MIKQVNKGIKVQDHPGLYRDPHSKAIINTDLNALREHRQKIKMENTVIENNKKINQLENDVSEIKSLLHMLINKK